MGGPGPNDTPVVLFDGVCNLCNASVRAILARDRKGIFRLASLQSQAARRVFAEAGAPVPAVDSVVLVEGGTVYTRSDVVIRVASRLGFPWSMAGVLRIVPRGLRDAVYDWIARNRYRWFGRKDACPVPTPEQRARFLDADEIAPVST